MFWYLPSLFKTTSKATFFCEINNAFLFSLAMFTKILAIVWDFPVPGGPIIIAEFDIVPIIAFSCEKSDAVTRAILFFSKAFSYASLA